VGSPMRMTRGKDEAAEFPCQSAADLDLGPELRLPAGSPKS
jgi:hypothetical protein